MFVHFCECTDFKKTKVDNFCGLFINNTMKLRNFKLIFCNIN